MAAKKKAGRVSVEAALEADLLKIAERDPDLACSATAALAVALAREVDSGRTMRARELLDALGEIAARAPAEERKDGLDELATRRTVRRRRAAAADQ